jgi:putative endonuclease
LHPLPRRPSNLAGLDHRAIGRLGETIAGLALEAKGYKILFRNFRGARDGEADLVCRHGRFLVFVEVKTRTSDKHGRPADAVTRSKQHLLLRAAKDWLARLPDDDIPVRMDVVEVLLGQGAVPEVHILADAFGDE